MKRFARMLGVLLAVIICMTVVGCGAAEYYENTTVPSFESVTGTAPTRTMGDKYVMYVYTCDADKRDVQYEQYITELKSAGFAVTAEEETSESVTALVKGTEGVIVSAMDDTSVTVMLYNPEEEAAKETAADTEE